MKQVSLILAGIILCYLPSSAQDNPNPSPIIDNFILGEMVAERFPGVSTVIVKDGQVVWLESYGLADVANNIPVEDTTVFLLASISKVFTGTAVMQLYEDGLLDLDEPINNHLPWTVDIPGFAADSITFRQLMTHSSSIEDNGPVMETYYDFPDPSIPLADCVQGYFSTNGINYSASENFLNAAPGTVYEYSNMATALNGYLAEVIAGSAFDQYCKTAIFDPLSMTKTAWFMADFDSTHVARPYQFVSGNYQPYPHYGFADYPDGQLRSNVVDLSKFMMAYLNEGTLGPNTILSSNAINEMWSDQVPALIPGQGLNWYLEELFHSTGSTWLWGHNGGEAGVSTDMYLDPTNNIGICVLTNGEGNAIFICDELYNYALALSPTSSNLVVASTEFTIQPNPATERITLNGEPGDYIVQILDASGQLYQQFKTTGQITVDINDLPVGLFFVSIRNEQQEQVSIQKLSKGL